MASHAAVFSRRRPPSRWLMFMACRYASCLGYVAAFVVALGQHRTFAELVLIGTLAVYMADVRRCRSEWALACRRAQEGRPLPEPSLSQWAWLMANLAGVILVIALPSLRV